MRALGFALVAFALVCTVVNAAQLGAVYTVPSLLCGAIALALLASGHRSSAAIAAGSLGALLAAIVLRFQLGHAAAGLALGMAMFAERTYRVRGDSLRGMHLAAAGLSGALAMHLAREFAGSDWQLPAAGLAAALFALPFALSAEDACAQTLHDRALLLSGEARAALLDVAELRRRAVTLKLDAAAQRETREAFAGALQISELMLSSATRQSGKNSQEIAGMLQAKVTALVTKLDTALRAAELAHVQHALGEQPAKLPIVEPIAVPATAPSSPAADDASAAASTSATAELPASHPLLTGPALVDQQVPEPVMQIAAR